MTVKESDKNDRTEIIVSLQKAVESIDSSATSKQSIADLQKEIEKEIDDLIQYPIKNQDITDDPYIRKQMNEIGKKAIILTTDIILGNVSDFLKSSLSSNTNLLNEVIKAQDIIKSEKSKKKSDAEP